MAYRKLGRDCKHRRSMFANLTKAVILNESINTTEDRAKEVRKFVDKSVDKLSYLCCNTFFCYYFNIFCICKIKHIRIHFASATSIQS